MGVEREGKQEKEEKIMQHCTIFCNQKSAKRQETGIKDGKLEV